MSSVPPPPEDGPPTPPPDDSGPPPAPAPGQDPPPPASYDAPDAFPPPPPPPPQSGGFPPPPAPGGYGPPPGYYPAGVMPPVGPDYQSPVAGSNGKATASLVMGIISIFCFGIVLGTAAIIVGVLARKEIAASRGLQSGSGFALAGIITGAVGLATNVLAYLWFFGIFFSS